jgi:hypothetical protein
MQAVRKMNGAKSRLTFAARTAGKPARSSKNEPEERSTGMARFFVPVVVSQ